MSKVLLYLRFGICLVYESTSRTSQTAYGLEIEQMNGKNDSDSDDTYDYCAHDTFSWFMTLKIFIK